MAIYSLNEEYENEYYDESYDEYDREDSIREACEYILDMLESTAADRHAKKLYSDAEKYRELHDKLRKSSSSEANKKADEYDGKSRDARDIAYQLNPHRDDVSGPKGERVIDRMCKVHDRRKDINNFGAISTYGMHRADAYTSSAKPAYDRRRKEMDRTISSRKPGSFKSSK